MIMIRFLHDSAALLDWMSGARQMIDEWTQRSLSEEPDAEQRRELFLQSVVRLITVRDKMLLLMCLRGR